MTPPIKKIFKELEKCNFAVSTDSRKNTSDTVYFGIKGESFDGNTFAPDALKGGALFAVVDNKKIKGKKILYVRNTVHTLQAIAKQYRKRFTIPMIVIGGSNGKTTTKELLRDVLKTKYKVHATEGSFNNHIGVPLSILSLKPETEIAVFEIGANHLGEHTELLNIIKPTHIVVTNNGKDHLEGFGGVSGARKANKEIYDWANTHNSIVFVHKGHKDLMKDSPKEKRILYPAIPIILLPNPTVTIQFENKIYKTKLTGEYNKENIETALAIGNTFTVEPHEALTAICTYKPTSKRSQFLKYKSNNFIVDCYNANPTSMQLSTHSFMETSKGLRGLILGDMLELGKYSKTEHRKILDFIITKKWNVIVLIGPEFKKVLKPNSPNIQWFPNSLLAHEWFIAQKFKNYTFLLKGSRGMKIEKIINL